MNKILITGCFGFVGSHWLDFLLSKGNYQITGIDIKDCHLKYKDIKNFNFKKISIFENQKMEELVKSNDYIFQFAAIPTPSVYLTDPIKIMDITAVQAIAITKMCNKHNKTIFFTSTSEIYGKNTKIPYKESSDRVLGSTDTLRWCYSSSKALVEHYIKAYHFKEDLNYVIFRLFNVYGTNLEGRVIDKFIINALQNKKITVYEKGHQTRCFLEIDDCVSAFYKIFKNKNLYNKTYNVGSDTQTKIIDLAKMIINLTNSKSEIEYISYNELSKSGYEDMFLRVPDSSLLINSTDWESAVSLETGLIKMIKELKNKYEL